MSTETWKERVVTDWDPNDPQYHVGTTVSYHGVEHRVIDAGDQGTRLAAVKNPFCPKAPNGFHCGHEIHRHAQTIGLTPAKTGRLTAKCCWCDDLVELNFEVVRVAFQGHGIGAGYDDEIWELPVEWHKGDA